MLSENSLKKIRASLILFCVLSLSAVTACLGGGTESNRDPGTFNATDLTDNSNYVITADLIYNGRYCKVYKDKNDTYMSPYIAKNMGIEFDNNIYSKVVTAFGTPADVDGDGKITLLVLDIKDGGTAQSYVSGYFSYINEYSTSTDPMTKYSNECDMIYMDSNPGAYYPDFFKQTMAHEFQHLINFNQKIIVQRSSTGFDTWIDEGLSSAAEKIYYGAQVQDKINYFNTDNNKDIVKGQRFIAWEKGNYNSILGNYSTVYLFFQWLNIQSENNNSIYKVIMDSDYDDYRAVYAAESHITNFTGTSFQELLRDWNIASLLCKSSGIYGYKGEISTAVQYFNNLTDNPSYIAGSSRSMLPGECIYAKATNYTITSASDIYSAGVNTATSAIDTAGTSYAGDVLLVYNALTVSSTVTAATGSLPPAASVVSVVKSEVKAESGTRRYPVDALLKFNGMHFPENFE